MEAFWSGSARMLMDTPRKAILDHLAHAQLRHHRTSEAATLRAWEGTIDCLVAALGEDARDWWVLLEFPMLRLGKRADAVLLAGRLIIVLEFKVGATSLEPSAREQADDYALDLRDFHAGSRRHPIVPILVATEARPRAQDMPLLTASVLPVMDASRESLAGLLRALVSAAPKAEALDPAAWMAAPYRPVPNIVEAACMLYARHGVEDIRASRSDATNLTRTTDAILEAIAGARARGEKLIAFVTGIPGAGKTLCGLNAAFGAANAARATFLTGNPTLVHVLREALARDAIRHGADRRLARQHMESAIQALPKFRDHHVATGEVPAERIVVVDEAQRCWEGAYAIRKTRDRPVRLSDSEPGHLLEIMGRHEGFAAMICLVGGGQEIHDGEGGLAEWGRALRQAPEWQVVAAPDLLDATDARQRLGDLPRLACEQSLHLDVPVRQIRNAAAASWVGAVLNGDRAEAGRIARAAELPFMLTRDLAAMRGWLRHASRGLRRCGLLASSGARRLRADGLGCELPHMDAQAVARWFLDRWPDVRASDALEVVATEFSCQGLELDYCGMCWDADLVRSATGDGWIVRDFRGSRWVFPKGAEQIANTINTYRVLLTRARYETVIFVPRGDAADATREPAAYDRVAAFLSACGVRPLETAPMHAQAPTRLVEPMLL